MINLDKIATEQRNQASSHIDQVSTLEMVTIINNEDKKVPEAITPLLPKIAKAVEIIAAHLHQGGRLFYVGSGTSGRLGIYAASVRRFHTEPEWFRDYCRRNGLSFGLRKGRRFCGRRGQGLAAHE